MKNNQWLDRVEKEVTVTLKKRQWSYQPGGPHVRDFDVDGAVPLIVKVKKYAMTHNEKLATIVQAALKHFADQINGYGQEQFDGYIDPVKTDEKEIVIDPKLASWSKGETPSAHLDKDHKIQHTTVGEAMLRSVARLNPPIQHKSVSNAMEEAKESCPKFLNEKPPQTRSMTDIQNWVREKQGIVK